MPQPLPPPSCDSGDPQTVIDDLYRKAQAGILPTNDQLDDFHDAVNTCIVESQSDKTLQSIITQADKIVDLWKTMGINMDTIKAPEPESASVWSREALAYKELLLCWQSVQPNASCERVMLQALLKAIELPKFNWHEKTQLSDLASQLLDLWDAQSQHNDQPKRKDHPAGGVEHGKTKQSRSEKLGRI